MLEPFGSRRDETPGRDLIRDPIVILAAPRSGSSALFGALSAHPDLWSRYRESNHILEGPFDPGVTGATSNALTEADLDEVSRDLLLRRFFQSVGNLEILPVVRWLPLRGRGRRRVSEAISVITRPFKHAPIRIVEKSPKNTLRVRFMKELFPDARFLHLVRGPRGNIASLYRAWQTPDRYKTYPLPPEFRIAGYAGDRWSFVLQPGWERLEGRTIVEICADQWRACNEACLRDLAELDVTAVRRVRYEDLVAQPYETLEGIAAWADLDPAPLGRFRGGLPLIQSTTKPDPHKWRALGEEIDSVMSQVEDVASALGYD
ncbi:MAG TPA: sulfotransferase [Actinomycetota bacterium]